MDILKKAMEDGPKVMSQNLGCPYQTAAHYRWLYKKGELSESQVQRIVSVYKHLI